jgi:hypothetical protein
MSSPAIGNWIIGSKDGRNFYFNTITRESTFSPPLPGLPQPKLGGDAVSCAQKRNPRKRARLHHEQESDLKSLLADVGKNVASNVATSWICGQKDGRPMYVNTATGEHRETPPPVLFAGTRGSGAGVPPVPTLGFESTADAGDPSVPLALVASPMTLADGSAALGGGFPAAGGGDKDRALAMNLGLPDEAALSLAMTRSHSLDGAQVDASIDAPPLRRDSTLASLADLGLDDVLDTVPLADLEALAAGAPGPAPSIEATVERPFPQQTRHMAKCAAAAENAGTPPAPAAVTASVVSEPRSPHDALPPEEPRSLGASAGRRKSRVRGQSQSTEDGTTGMDNDAVRRLKNRKAAARCRSKRLARCAQLEDRVGELEGLVSRLKQKLAVSEAENGVLKAWLGSLGYKLKSPAVPDIAKV